MIDDETELVGLAPLHLLESGACGADVGRPYGRDDQAATLDLDVFDRANVDCATSVGAMEVTPKELLLRRCKTDCQASSCVIIFL